MTTREDVEPVFQKALAIMDEREEIYGDAWKTNGPSVCMAEVIRKSNYIRVQWEREKADTPKFAEDLLDLINWAAYAYWHINNKETI